MNSRPSGPASNARTVPHDVPLLEVVDLVIEPDPARAGHHDVRLLLLAVAVGHRRAHAGRVPEMADPEGLRIQVLASEASLDARRPAGGGILEVHQVLERET